MLLELFERVYVINLPARTDRRREMAAQLQRVGLSFDDPRVVLFPAVRPSDKGDFPSVGARGCFMSHLGVLKHIQNAPGSGRALILEDDCDFVGDVLPRLAQLAAPIRSAQWSIFYGGALNTRDVAMLDTMGPVGAVAPQSGIMGSHFIALNLGVAAEVVDYLERMLQRPPGHPDGGPMHVDGAYSWFRREHPHHLTWIARPDLCLQRSSATDVHVRPWFDQLPLLRHVVAFARKTKNQQRDRSQVLK